MFGREADSAEKAGKQAFNPMTSANAENACVANLCSKCRPSERKDMGAAPKEIPPEKPQETLHIVTREGAKVKPGETKRRGRTEIRRQSHGAVWILE
jgi:hypothetical protein